MKIILSLFALSGCCFCAPLYAVEESHAETVSIYKIDVEDGSLIFARPKTARVNIKPWGRETTLRVDWSMVHEIQSAKENPEIIVSFKNGDLLTGVWADKFLIAKSTFGDLRIPTERIRGVSAQKGTRLVNVALGKPVFGQDGASHGKGLAKHLTDGDLESHAKPPASHFDYTVQLSEEGEDGQNICAVRIHWGRFGDRFKGIRASNGDGWASAAWPGEYVTSYQLHYRVAGSDTWKGFHTWSGRPVDEVASNVDVERLPTEIEGCSSESITTLSGLELTDVAAIRIEANGGHWIGLHELEVFSRE